MPRGFGPVGLFFGGATIRAVISSGPALNYQTHGGVGTFYGPISYSFIATLVLADLLVPDGYAQPVG